jgi:hypothetical protein
MSGDVIKLGDRRFRSVGVTSIAQDLHVWRCARAAGIKELEIGRGESPDEFAKRITDGLLETDLAFEMLGGLLVPDGEPEESWTPEMAADTAAYLRTIRDERSKAVFRMLVVSVILGFLERGLVSLIASRASSMKGETALRDRAKGGRTRARGESGPASSESSQGGTMRRLFGWLGGRLWRRSRRSRSRSGATR